jgi:hypothetical protein
MAGVGVVSTGGVSAGSVSAGSVCAGVGSVGVLGFTWVGNLVDDFFDFLHCDLSLDLELVLVR